MDDQVKKRLQNFILDLIDYKNRNLYLTKTLNSDVSERKLFKNNPYREGILSNYKYIMNAQTLLETFKEKQKNIEKLKDIHDAIHENFFVITGSTDPKDIS